MTTLLCLIDGMRPDGLAGATTPTLDRLMAAGVWTADARTVMPSITLPCITSLFVSTPPADHGVTTNTWTPQTTVHGLADVLARAGHAVGFFYNWEPIRDLSRPGSLQAAIFVKGDDVPKDYADAELADATAAYLRGARHAGKPLDFAFLYLGNVDAIGHRHGWLSQRYMEAITLADRCVGRVLDAAGEGARAVVLADHGGHDTRHGSEAPEDMRIPIVMAGEGVPAAGELAGPVSILDVAPTIARWFGLAPHPAWLGTEIKV